MYTPLQEAIDQKDTQELLNCQHEETEQVQITDYDGGTIIVTQCVRCLTDILR